MKPESLVKARLRETKTLLKQVTRSFEKYDNHDDMEEMDRLRREVEVLEWVLQ